MTALAYTETSSVIANRPPRFKKTGNVKPKPTSNPKVTRAATRKAIPAADYLASVYDIHIEVRGFWRCVLKIDGTLSRQWIESAMTD